MITYKELLERIEGQQNHLLIANGFNRGLGVNTSYHAIFDKMIDNNDIYKEAQSSFVECGYDLEVFLGKLEASIIGNTFLQKYIKNNIKLDFMRATHDIVKSKIKNIYSEKNEGIFILLKNFSTYFTLNYDSFLYLLLLKYKPSEDNANNAIALEPTLNFIEDDCDIKANNIYTEIKKARQEGVLKITINNDNDIFEKSLGKLPKTHFVTEVKAYSKSNKKGWKDKDIKRVVEFILKEEMKNQVLQKVDDGSRQLGLFDGQPQYIFEDRETQNLFFLHGAFHIYRDGQLYKKITQQTDKALYDRLEDILNNDNQEIVCVFQHDNKIDVIDNNKYLSNCLNKLERLSGNVVIIGSSLADNDNHIFSRINNSQIDTVYVSAIEREEDIIQDKARIMFPSKNICIFNAETISYELHEELN